MSFNLLAKTIESQHMPLSMVFNHEMTHNLDIEPNSYIHIKLTGIDLSYYPEFTLTASNFVYMADDEIVFKTHDDVIIPPVTSLVLSSQNVNVNGDVDVGIIKINNTEINDIKRKITVIDSLRFNANDGFVTLVSDADYYLGGYHEIEFDISDRERYIGTALINSPVRFYPNIEVQHTDYVVTISNATQRGLSANIDNDVLFNIKSSYETYSINYGYSFVDNSSWYTFYKLQNNTPKDSQLIITALFTKSGPGVSDIQKCEYNYGYLNKYEAVNLTGSDILSYCGLTGNYHIAVKFHSEQELIVASQNASPNGRTVNLIE